MEGSGTITPVLKHTFSLKALSTHQKIKDVQCDFSPLLCRQTYQLIRTTPTYNRTLDPPFQQPAGTLRLMQTLKHEVSGPYLPQNPKLQSYFPLT